MPVSRFAALAGIPERTYRYRLARLRSGAMRGLWPAPAVDAIEELAAKYAESWPAWGHRKIAALLRADGHAVSTSTVERALRRRNLLLPKGFRADRKSWAMLRVGCSATRRPNGTESGRWTSASSRPRRAGSGGSAR